MNANLVLYILMAIFAVLSVFLFMQTFALRAKLNRLFKKYNYYMSGEDGISVERKLSVEVKELREMTQAAEQMIQQQEIFFQAQNQSFQKIGLVKYDAFDDTGDKLSFSLTVMDGMNNGFVLSSLVGRENSRIYSKRIIGGQCKEALSSEEAESINLALQSRENIAAAEKKESSSRSGKGKVQIKIPKEGQESLFQGLPFFTEASGKKDKKEQVKNEASGE